MTQLTVNILGSIASILGLIVALLAVFSEEYRFLSVVSLLIVETLGIAVWIYYVRSRHKREYPYDWEAEFYLFRYIYDSPTKAHYEVIRSLRVTTHRLNQFPIRHWWNGRGNISLRSIYSAEEIPFEHDGKTGTIKFNYPLHKDYTFGDSLTTHYTFDLEDMSKTESPDLSLLVMTQVKLVVFEVVLKYKQENANAVFSDKLIEDSSAHMGTKICEIPFDPHRRTYRKVFSNPTIGYTYRLNWKQ